MILLFLSLFAFHALQAENFFLALTSLWLVASPLPVFLSVQEPHLNCKLGKIIINPPFDHSRLEAHVKNFSLQFLKASQYILHFRILMICTQIFLMVTGISWKCLYMLLRKTSFTSFRIGIQ